MQPTMIVLGGSEAFMKAVLDTIIDVKNEVRQSLFYDTFPEYWYQS